MLDQSIPRDLQLALERRPRVYSSYKRTGEFDFKVWLEDGKPDKLGKTIWARKSQECLVDLSTVCDWTFTEAGEVEFKIEGTTFQSAADVFNGYSTNRKRLTVLLRMDLRDASHVIAFCNDDDDFAMFELLCNEWNDRDG